MGVVAEGLSKANAARQGPGIRPACLKVRCGGAEAAAFPSVGELAGAIAAARDHGVVMKATQGLHQPFHHVDEAIGTPAHGFVNLMTAGALARAHNLPAERVAAILADEEPAHFVFSEEGLSWRGLSLTVAEIAGGRRYGVASFGSCSFDEPLEGLRSSGVLG
jgi:alkylated DNA nucleotide flippase Atl1